MSARFSERHYLKVEGNGERQRMLTANFRACTVRGTREEREREREILCPVNCLLTKPLPEFPMLSASFLPASCGDSCVYYFPVIFPPPMSHYRIPASSRLLSLGIPFCSNCSKQMNISAEMSFENTSSLINKNFPYSGKGMTIACENMQKSARIPFFCIFESYIRREK